MQNILIGTMSRGDRETPKYIESLGKLGFECTEITFGQDCTWLTEMELDAYAAACMKALKQYGCKTL